MNRRKKYNLSKYFISQIENAIKEWIPNRQYREILKFAFLDGESKEAIAEMVNCSIGMVRYVIKQSVPHLINYMEIDNNEKLNIGSDN